MASVPWSYKEDALMRAFYPLRPNSEVVAILAEHGFRRSLSGVTAHAKKLGISKDRERGYVKRQPRKLWTPEREAWFREFVPGHTESEISAECERLFGFPLSEGQIGNAKHAFGVKSGSHGGQFKKGSVPANKGRTWDEYMPAESQERCRQGLYRPGNVPHNQNDLLAIRRYRDREGRLFTQIKVDPRNAKYPVQYWIGYEKFVWMQHNGCEWPEGCRALFIDGDRENFDPENIYPCPKEIYPMVMGAVRSQMTWHDRETLEIAVLNARITLTMTRLAKQAGRKGRS